MRCRPGAARRPTRPQLEALEDRTLLAVGFQTLGPTAVGGAPTDLAAADFNGDGKPDLAVTIYTDPSSTPRTGAVAVLLNNGDGGFKPVGSYSLGMDPHAVAVGDFNGDGKADLVVTQRGSGLQDGGVTVLLGNGDGTFQAPLHYSVSSANTLPERAEAGDFNGDGKLDLAVLNPVPGQGNDLVSILLGKGDATFQAPTDYPVGKSIPGSIAAGDFNRDGKPDLVTANYGSRDLEVLLGNGDGTFQPAVSYAPGQSVSSVVVGDLNGDGRADLIASSGDGIEVLLGNGDGTFQAAFTSPIFASAAAIAVSDVDGDGKADLVVSPGRTYGSSISILPGNGDGTFGPASDYPTDLQSDGRIGLLAVRDFNSDGVPDIVAARDASSAAPAGKIWQLLNANRHASPTGTALTLAPNLVFTGEAVTLTATVTPSAPATGVPTGTVAFLERIGSFVCAPRPLPVDCSRTDLAGTAPVDANGHAALTVEAELGLLSVEAVYGGDPNFTASTSPAVPLPVATASPNRGFVLQLYHDLLRRGADAAGLDFFAGVLDGGQATRLQVVQTIQASEEYRSVVVNQTVSNLLGRPASAADTKFWLQFLNQGGSVLQMQALILGSEEYFQQRAGGNNLGFVQGVFRAVLNRDVSANEAQAFGQLLAGGVGRAQVALTILTSQEAAADAVQALVQQYLHHAPDATSAAFFASVLRQGATQDQITALVVSSPEYFAAINNSLAARNVEQRYVAQLYRDLLQRQAGATDLGYWTGLLDQGVLTPRQLVQQIQASNEYRTLVLQQAYATYLHRAAAPEELAFFLAGLAAGGTIEQVGVALTGSGEYFQQRGGGAADGFLQALYQDVLGRAPGPADQAAWSQALAQGATPANVAAILFGSEEYDKNLVQQLFLRALHRPADAAGLALWTTALSEGVRDDQVLAVLAASDEYFAELA